MKFDPRQISYREILEVFFSVHDPTTKDRQGPDVGPQYRSVIFYHSEEQRRTAEGVISELEARRVWERPIVTELAPFTAFYPAEE
ncbi:peptide-methionine (S)-S-oxide reductase, partial [Escherichia coli]|nr:peptide-methionine (S)-S-oxide reductase [Escherichia coli]